jgi:hypothetical protein
MSFKKPTMRFAFICHDENPSSRWHLASSTLGMSFKIGRAHVA